MQRKEFMATKILLSVAGILLVSTPLSSSAQTNASAHGFHCAVFTHDFGSGATDAITSGEVSKLQKFLASAGIYPEASITGYFGPATLRALQRWQAMNGFPITAGTGFFGPKTRATIQRKCKQTGNKTQMSGSLSYFHPNYSDAKKKRFGVAFRYSTQPLCNSLTTTDDFSIDTGDGGTHQVDCSGTTDHTYTTAGTYTARYLKNGIEIAQTTVVIN